MTADLIPGYHLAIQKLLSFSSLLVLTSRPRIVICCVLTMLLASIHVVEPLEASDPPLLPFNNPGDLLVLDHGCGCILRVSPDRLVSVHLTHGQIRNVAQVGEVCFEAGGLAFDADGALYFVEGENQILKQSTNGTLERLARGDFLISAQPGAGAVRIANIVVGSDGFVYATDSENDSLLRVDPMRGFVSLVANRSDLFNALGSGVNLEGLVGDEHGTLFAFSRQPPSMFSVMVPDGPIQLLAGGSSLSSPGGFATRAPNRDLIVSDKADGRGVHRLFAVTRAGQASVFLSGEMIAEAVPGLSPEDVNLEGGIAFNNEGMLFITESESDNLLKFDCATGEVSIWVTPAELEEASGEDPDLRAGIAFASRGQIAGPFMPSISDDPESRHARVDSRPHDGAPGAGDDTLILGREQNMMAASSSDRLDSQLLCRMSNRHPLTGHYQTCSVNTPLRDPLGSLFSSLGKSSILDWGKRILFQVLGDRSLENTITIDSYDSNLRPTAFKVEHRIGPLSVESQVRSRDEDGDGITEAFDLQTIVPLAIMSVEPELVDTNLDGIDDYVGFVYHKNGLKAFLPIVDTNGDGVPDSPAIDADGDNQPDPDLPLFSFLAGPANPTVEHKLHFAQFGDGAVEDVSIFSEITLFNLDLENPAQVKLLLKDDNGNPLSVDLNGEIVAGEKELVVPPGGAAILRTDGLGELAAGSVTVCSDRVVGGVIRFGGTAGVAGVGVSHRHARGFIASIERSAADAINTGAAFMNIENVQATYTLNLCDLEGQALAEAELKLPPMGHRALFVDEINWSPSLDLTDFRGLLKATSTGTAVATVLQTRPGEFATLPVAPNFAQPSGATNGLSATRRRHLLSQATSPELNEKLYFAQFGNGVVGGVSLFSQLILFNLTDKPANVRLILKDDAGEPLTVTLDGETIVGQQELIIPPGGLRILETDGEGEAIVGSATVCSDQALEGVIVFGGSSGVAGVGSSAQLLRGFVAPVQGKSAESLSTGAAVMNLEDTSNQLDLTLCDIGGKKLATAQMLLPAMGHQALFLHEISWQAEAGVELDFADFEGLLKVFSSGRTAATVLLTQPGVLATQPVVPPL